MDIYYDRRLAEYGNIANETWSILNYLRNKAYSSCIIPTTHDNLNNHFVNVTSNLTNKITLTLSYLTKASDNLHHFT